MIGWACHQVDSGFPGNWIRVSVNSLRTKLRVLLENLLDVVVHDQLELYLVTQCLCQFGQLLMVGSVEMMCRCSLRYDIIW